MFSLSKNRLYRALPVVLALLLAGCPNPHLEAVRSTNLSTQEIGLDLSIEQFEGRGEVSLTADMYRTDGVSKTAVVTISGNDTMQASVLDQDIEVVSENNGNGYTFTVQQSSLRLPATFKLEFLRAEGQEQALDTYITVNAMFETISPIDGDIFSTDDVVEFAWTFRDSDGNTVDAPNEIDTVLAETFEPYKFRRVPFDTIESGPDGFSKKAYARAIDLIPGIIFSNGGFSSRNISAYVTKYDFRVTLPIVFNVDPALANNQTTEVFDESSRVRSKRVIVTVQ